MKRIVLLLVLALCAYNLQAQTAAPKIKWLSFEQALAENAKAPKFIFVDLYTDWCGRCKVMDKNTFADTVIAKYMSENFYCVKFNAEGKNDVKFFGRVNKFDSLTMQNTVVMDTVVFKHDPTAGRNGTHQLAIALTDGKLSYPSFVLLDNNIQRLDIIQGYQPPPPFETMLHFFVDGAYKTMSFEDFSKTFTPLSKAPVQQQPVAPGH